MMYVCWGALVGGEDISDTTSLYFTNSLKCFMRAHCQLCKLIHYSSHTDVFSHLSHLPSVFLWIQNLLIRVYEVKNMKLSVQAHLDASVIAKHSHIFPIYDWS